MNTVLVSYWNAFFLQCDADAP